MLADSEKEYLHLLEKRAGVKSEIMEMENFYFVCQITGNQKSQELDEYEKDYGYKAIWIKPAEALAKNESIKDFETIPWVRRESMVLREVIGEI